MAGQPGLMHGVMQTRVHSCCTTCRSDLHGLMAVFFGKDGRKSLSLVGGVALIGGG